jgi:hypothetical protein
VLKKKVHHKDSMDAKVLEGLRDQALDAVLEQWDVEVH